MLVLLDNYSKAKTFNQLASGLLSEIDIVRGRYVIDAKSYLGMLSLDLSKPIEIVVHEFVPSEKAQFEKQLRNLGLAYEE